jgi:hypothetical protein
MFRITSQRLRKLLAKSCNLVNPLPKFSAPSRCAPDFKLAGCVLTLKLDEADYCVAVPFAKSPAFTRIMRE